MQAAFCAWSYFTAWSNLPDFSGVRKLTPLAFSPPNPIYCYWLHTPAFVLSSVFYLVTDPYQLKHCLNPQLSKSLILQYLKCRSNISSFLLQIKGVCSQMTLPGLLLSQVVLTLCARTLSESRFKSTISELLVHLISIKKQTMTFYFIFIYFVLEAYLLLSTTSSKNYQ